MNKEKIINKIWEKEKKRQNNQLTFIASENYAPLNVLKAQGSIFTNKYIEGYPNKRYYEGCENIDALETLVIKLVKKVYKCDHANVQPHSGSQANAAAYLSILKPNDKVLSMSLDSGGHLTHGHRSNFSGLLYNFKHYYVDKKSEKINYNVLEKLARDFHPKLIIAGASTYSRIIDFKRISEISKLVGAFLMVDMAHIAGLVATNLHPSPIPFADIVTTTTHKTLRGARGGLIMCKNFLKKRIDMAIFPGTQGGVIGGSLLAKAFTLNNALSVEFKNYQNKVITCSKILSKSFKKGRIISGGTDNHQFSIDVNNSYGLTGSQASKLLKKANVLVNKNLIPFDPLPSIKTSGIRLGTPACVTRGLEKKDFRILGELMEKVLIEKNNFSIENLKIRVEKLCITHPLTIK